MQGKDILQKWQKDFYDFYDVYPTFIIDGYIDDLQPYIELENIDQNIDQLDIEKVSICEYFEKLFKKKEFRGKRNLLIVYDPTEAVGRRFDIKADFIVNQNNNEENNQQNSSPYPNIEFIECELANHFYEVLKSEKIENQLMDHAYDGVSPDFAKIHYVLSEKSRIKDYENIFKDFFQFFTQLISSVDFNQETNYVFVIKMISRLKTGNDSKNLSFDELGIFRQLLAITESIANSNKINNENHKLIILADNNSSLPGWFANESENYQVKNLHISRPNKNYKKYFFNRLIENQSFGVNFTNQYNEQCVPRNSDNDEESYRKKQAERQIFKKFDAYSNDFSMQQLCYYEKYLDDEDHKIDSIDKLSLSLSMFKYGELKDPWEDSEIVKKILNIEKDIHLKAGMIMFIIMVIQFLVLMKVQQVNKIIMLNGV